MTMVAISIYSSGKRQQKQLKTTSFHNVAVLQILMVFNLKRSMLFYDRMIHPGKGLPSEMLSDMFETRDGWVTPDGLGLKLSRKLLEQMNGRVSYVREDERCFFQVDLQVKTMLGVESRGTEGSSSIK